jgi:hypothetical protein
MNRRDVIRTLGGALVVAPFVARAEPAAGRFTIGMLGVASPEQSVGTYGAFHARMRDLGYVRAATSATRPAGPTASPTGFPGWPPSW